MNIQTATLTIESLSPLSQSRNCTLTHPKLPGEGPDKYDARIWRDKLNTDADGRVVIPAHGMHQALIAAARYCGKQIPGQGKKTWTAKFMTGVMLTDDIVTDRTADDATMLGLQVSTTGTRGVGKRALRRFPMLDRWAATFELIVLDPIIDEPILREMVGLAGMFVGVGRFRPEVGGHNGRFALKSLTIRGDRISAAA